MPKKPLPKHIMGVKIPKALRKSDAGRALASRFGQNVMADALVGIVGAGLAQMGDKKSPLRKELRHSGHDSVMADALGAALSAFTKALRDGHHRR